MPTPEQIAAALRNQPDGIWQGETLGQRTQSLFGLDPNIDRPTGILPTPDIVNGKKDWTSWTAPEWFAGLGTAIATPAYAASGNEITPAQAVNFATNVMGGGMGASKVTPPPSGSIGMFIGPSSKKWDELAPKLTGPDQLLRQELSDQAASVKGTGTFGDTVMDTFNKNKDVFMKTQDGEVLLKDVFNHPEVFEAYPALQDYKIRILKEGQPLKGRKGTDYTMGVRSDLGPEEAKSVILHEMQHHIQEDEGFAKGGSARVFFKDLMEQHNKYNDQITQLNTEMRAASGTPKYENLLDEKLSLIKEAQNLGVLYPEQVERQALNKYTRLGGEAEARLTQARMNLTPEERLAQNPFDPEIFKKATGIPLEDVILQGNRKDLLRQEIDKLSK